MTHNDTITFARKLRREQTSAEDLFWAQVRNRRFHHLKFRRQVPIQKYFADFVCETYKLVIELDDCSHADKQDYDTARTACIEREGYTVLRFLNADIYDNINGVLDHIARYIQKRD